MTEIDFLPLFLIMLKTNNQPRKNRRSHLTYQMFKALSFSSNLFLAIWIRYIHPTAPAIPHYAGQTSV